MRTLNADEPSSAFEQGSASHGQSGGLDEGCGGLPMVLVVAPQLFLQRCSMEPLLPSGFLNQTSTGTVSNATLGERLRDGVERIRIFPSA